MHNRISTAKSLSIQKDKFFAVDIQHEPFNMVPDMGKTFTFDEEITLKESLMAMVVKN